MENKKVAIIISTYNGEKYLKEQLDSLINQTYSPIDIYIRDDGSKDNTVNILNEYKEKYSNFHVVTGENLGYARSFYTAVKFAFENENNYDYFAFCDQDDKWHLDKIANAVKMMDNDEIPECLYTEYNICDEKLNFIKKSKLDKGKSCFRNSLTEATISGNTSMFNRLLVKELMKFNIEYVCCHDWLVYMIASGLGKTVYDSNSSLEYRRTGGNASPRENGKLKLLIYRLKKFIFGDYLKELKKQILEYKNQYYELLSTKNKKLIDLFVDKNYNVIHALRKTFYLKRFRQAGIDEFLIRFVFLIGKL